MHLLLFAAALLSIGPVESGSLNRQPQLATSGGMTALVFGNHGSVWFSKSMDKAKTFSAPVRVGGDKALALGRHRGPRVVIRGNMILVSAVLGSSVSNEAHAHGLPQNGDLVVWRSVDGGTSWAGPVVVDDVPGAAREGLHAMAASSDGTIAVAWLDLRSKGTKLYGSYSRDAGLTWSKNVLLYEAEGGTICQCCHPSIASDGGSRFLVMFRNVIGESRDLYVTRWDTTAQTVSSPKKEGTGSWSIDACPMDGGGLAVINGLATTAWRRGESVFLAQNESSELELGKGKDVALAVTKTGSYVSWTGVDGVELLTPGSRQPVLIGAKGNFSTLLPVTGGGVLASWECDGSIKIAALK